MSLPNPSPPDLPKVQAVRVVENVVRSDVGAYANMGKKHIQVMEENGRRKLASMIAQEYAEDLHPELILGDEQAYDLREYEPDEVSQLIKDFDLDPVQDEIEVRHRAYVIAPHLIPEPKDPAHIVDSVLQEVGMNEIRRFLPHGLFAKLRTKLIELVAKFTDFEIKVKHPPHGQSGGAEDEGA